MIKSVIECYDEITIGVQSCAQGIHGAGNWDKCTLTGNQRPHFYISIRKICEETEGGGGGTGGGGTGGGSTGGGGGGGTGPTPGNPTPLVPVDPNGPQSPERDFGAVITRPVLAIKNKALLFAQGLSIEQREFWEDENNEEAKDAIKNYLHENLYSDESLVQANEMLNSVMDGTAISLKPFFKYPPNSNYATLYPKLTEYLKNQIPLLKDNQFIINKLVEYSELTESKITSDLQWSKEPTIVITQLDNACDVCNSDVYGLFKSDSPNILNVDIDFVLLLEDSLPGPQGDSLAFLLGVTILHEYVHLGDNVDGNDQPGEEGILFEEATYGESIWLNNANDVIIKWQQ